MDAGNDLQTAEDNIPRYHRKGIQNANVAVIEIDSKASKLQGSTPIPNIS